MNKVSSTLKALQNKILVNGQMGNSTSNVTLPVINPATEEVFSSIAAGNEQDLEIAIQGAINAKPIRANERAKLLHRLADLIKRDFEEMAILESIDTGKTLNDARAVDIPAAINTYRYFAGWADKLEGKSYQLPNEQYAYSIQEPVGIVGAIFPWNFPTWMMANKFAPAFAAGCQVILKPPEDASLPALKMASLFVEAGFPTGSVSVITGLGTEVGRKLVEHPKINKISFTGSTNVGKEIISKSAIPNIKRLQMELGGKSANIIFDDCDLDYAVQQAHDAAYCNQGQSCNAGTRTFVHSKIYDAFVEKAIKLAEKKVVGDPLQAATQQGPQISKKQMDRVLNYIDIGKKEGANLVTGGQKLFDKGYFIKPAIFTNVTDEMVIAKEEIFGPVMSILKFDSADEVVRRANSSPYGLASGIVTKDLKLANQMARQLKSGMVYINSYDVFDMGMPFGGMKDSGFGRECSKEGIDSYLELKTIVIG